MPRGFPHNVAGPQHRAVSNANDDFPDPPAGYNRELVERKLKVNVFQITTWRL